MKVRRALAMVWAPLALLTPHQGLAQAVRDGATARATTTIAPHVAIWADHDFILGSVLLRSASAMDGILIAHPTVRVGAVVDTASEDRPIRIDFVVLGEANQSISIAVPAAIDLISDSAAGKMTVEVLGNPRLGGVQILSDIRDGSGKFSFTIDGRFVVDRKTVAGSYRGLLAAIAQYN